MNLVEAKRDLIALLKSWKSNHLDSPWDVQDEAELIEEKLIIQGVLQVQHESEGVAAQVDSVLNQLTNVKQQSVLPEDIDIMLYLLTVSETEISTALKDHEDYWVSLDYRAREHKVKEYWF